MGVEIADAGSTDGRELPPTAASRQVPGVRHGILVKAELVPASETTPPALIISVQKAAGDMDGSR